jgi:hypothetical protein
MSEWQVLYLVLIVTASIWCRDGRIAAVMWANFICSMALAASFELVATVDLVSICFLIGKRVRRNIIAALFVFMLPIYLIGTAANQTYAASAVVDLLAYLQLFIMGRGDVGLGNLGRHLRGRRDRWRGSLEAGAAPARRDKVHSADHR